MGVSYIPVARAGELAAGQMKEIDLGGRQVLLAFAEGKYFAFARQCPHEDADLKNGVLDGAKVRCANHNYCFDPSTRSPALAEGSRSGFRPTGVVEGVTGLPVGAQLAFGRVRTAPRRSAVDGSADRSAGRGDLHSTGVVIG